MKNLSLALALVLGIGLFSCADTATAQATMMVVKPQDYYDLELKFAELDKLPSDVIVKLDATDPKDPRTFTITIERKLSDKRTQKIAQVDYAHLADSLTQKSSECS